MTTLCHTDAELRNAIALFLLIGFCTGVLLTFGMGFVRGQRYERRRSERGNR